MKKTSLVMNSILVLFIPVILINGCKVEYNKNDYLRKVLGKLEHIKSAAYNSTHNASAPGDTLKFRTLYSQTQEYFNPR